MIGKIKYLNETDGYGFIEADSLGSDDIKFYYHDEDVSKGSLVSFKTAVARTSGKPYAEDVKPVITFEPAQLKECCEFAVKMIGNHNPGMIMDRSSQEIFRDDLRGKLAEVALYNYLKKYLKGARIDGNIDYEATGRGQWDLFDMIVNGKYLSIKSVKQGSSFLMIETYRFNKDGTYSYVNDDGSEIRADVYILIRVTINNLDGSVPEKSRDGFDIHRDMDTLVKEESARTPDTVYAEILGGITHEEFWKNKHVARRYIPCDLNHLRKVCKGEDVLPVSDPSEYNENNKKTQILQQENYIFSSKQLKPIKELL